MKVSIASKIRALSASLKSDIKKSEGVNKIVVFLGGECPEGNEWRKEVEKEFKDEIFFLDPYDESWKADENIYNELEGLLKSDHVVFYKGGPGTKKEIKFLDSLGSDGYETFSDLNELKKYLEKISKGSKTKKEPVDVTLRNILSSALKESFPHAGALDLHFELMDKDSVESLKQDIMRGEYINVDPAITENYSKYGLKDFDGDFILKQHQKNIELESALSRPSTARSLNPPFIYDNNKHEIRIKTAKKGQDYELSSTQVDLPEDLADKVMSWGKKIPEEELYVEDDGGCGREDEIHVTLLYGLTDSTPEGVEKVLRGVSPFEVSLGTVTAFLDNDKNDVLKIDVDSPELQKLHYVLEDNLPNENSYPTYQPHVTIAYLKKGEAEKYIGSDDFRGKKFTADEIVFSSKDGTKISIKLER